MGGSPSLPPVRPQPNPPTRADARQFAGALIAPRGGRQQDVYASSIRRPDRPNKKRTLIGGDTNGIN